MRVDSGAVRPALRAFFNGAEDAATAGYLDIDGNCAYLTDGNERTNLLLFPWNAVVGWDGTTLRWQGEEYVQGDLLQLGGAGDALPEDAHLAAYCDASIEAWFINPQPLPPEGPR